MHACMGVSVCVGVGVGVGVCVCVCVWVGVCLVYFESSNKKLSCLADFGC